MAQVPNPVFTLEYDRLREVLIRVREDTGMSQTDLARCLGRTPPHVNLIEVGQRRVDILEFYRLVRALGREPAEVAHEVFEAFRRVEAETPLSTSTL